MRRAVASWWKRLWCDHTLIFTAGVAFCPKCNHWEH